MRAKKNNTIISLYESYYTKDSNNIKKLSQHLNLSSTHVETTKLNFHTTVLLTNIAESAIFMTRQGFHPTNCGKCGSKYGNNSMAYVYFLT